MRLQASVTLVLVFLVAGFGHAAYRDDQERVDLYRRQEALGLAFGCSEEHPVPGTAEAPDASEPSAAHARRDLDRAAQDTGVNIFAPGPVPDPATDRSLSTTTTTDPAAALDRLLNSFDSARDFEALRKVYPSMHTGIVRRVEALLQQMDEPADHPTRLRAKKITGISVLPSKRQGQVEMFEALGAVPVEPEGKADPFAALGFQAGR